MNMSLFKAEKCISQWSLPPKTPAVETDEVHVWRASLDADESCLSRLERVLSREELERANRFYFRKDREYFITTRGLLRTILARYLEKDASQLQFSYNGYGKPFLAGKKGRQRLCFNVSHSDGLALFAVAQERDIGIDVERIRPHFADEDIIEQFFSPGEIAALRALPVSMQPEAFFCCWTRKEAYLKARGKGLALRLDRFEVPVYSTRPTSLVATINPHGDTSGWSIWHLTPMPGCIGALAAKGNGCTIKLRQWETCNLSL